MCHVPAADPLSENRIAGLTSALQVEPHCYLYTLRVEPVQGEPHLVYHDRTLAHRQISHDTRRISEDNPRQSVAEQGYALILDDF